MGYAYVPALHVQLKFICLHFLSSMSYLFSILMHHNFAIKFGKNRDYHMKLAPGNNGSPHQAHNSMGHNILFCADISVLVFTNYRQHIHFTLNIPTITAQILILYLG